MIRTKTVFVVGAGASAEVDLPVGSDLTVKIADKLRMKEEDYRGTAFADQQMRQAMKELPLDSAIMPYGDCVASANAIRLAMPLAPSIDTYLDAHRDDKLLNLVGKVAIVASILDAEKGSLLYVDRSNIYNRPNFSCLRTTWFGPLWHILSTGIDKGSVTSIFTNVSFIVFNYDRCIEQFLYEALMVYYQLLPPKASEIMKTLTIIHPYGVVGHLPRLHGGGGVEFGKEVDPNT